MYLYHYNKVRFSVLLSLRKQGNLSASELRESEQRAKDQYSPAPYIDNISFFIDPIPTMQIGKIYPKDHKVWVDGNQLYEHIVDVSKLEHNILFSLVESTTDSDEVDATDDDAVFDRVWYKNKSDRKLRTGETGRGLDKLIKQIEKYQRTLPKKLVEASRRKYFNDPDVSSKYAAFVPHLMLYPSRGVIPVIAANLIEIGKPRL